MVQLNNRERRVDVEKLEESQVDALSEQIGKRLQSLIDEAVNEANRIVKVYGLEAKMQFSIKPVQKGEKKVDG